MPLGAQLAQFSVTTMTKDGNMRTMTSPLITRRTLIKSGGLAAVGELTLGAGPCSGPSKDKAVRVSGFIINLAQESLPLLELLGAKDLAQLVRDKAIPALEKLKEALSNADIPVAGSTLTTVRGVLGSLTNALLNLPQSPRRTTIIGIIASINVLLLTVEAFVESEMSGMSKAAGVAALNAPQVGEKMLKVLEATRQ